MSKMMIKGEKVYKKCWDVSFFFLWSNNTPQM